MRPGLLFFLTPLLELYLLIEVGAYIGAWTTVALVVLSAIVGVSILRRQGLAVLSRGIGTQKPRTSRPST
ncbi:MAG: FxsA family protein [Gammaproteobacteria bacterium]|nr:FxsA family protein [Gammaproteobacteria bacterium]